MKYATLQEALASGKKPARCCLKDDGTPKEAGGDKLPASSGAEAAAPAPSSNSEGDEPSLPEDSAAAPAQSAGTYISSKNSKKFHKAGCAGAARIKESNRVVFKSRDEAVASGRTPAADCKP